MLKKYDCSDPDRYKNALKEVIQEIALLGLFRGAFFDKAAFYGGTALRIFYGIERFSQDLDFSLLEPDKKFRIAPTASPSRMNYAHTDSRSRSLPRRSPHART